MSKHTEHFSMDSSTRPSLAQYTQAPDSPPRSLRKRQSPRTTGHSSHQTRCHGQQMRRSAKATYYGMWRYSSFLLSLNTKTPLESLCGQNGQTHSSLIDKPCPITTVSQLWSDSFTVEYQQHVETAYVFCAIKAVMSSCIRETSIFKKESSMQTLFPCSVVQVQLPSRIADSSASPLVVGDTNICAW